VQAGRLFLFLKAVALFAGSQRVANNCLQPAPHPATSRVRSAVTLRRHRNAARPLLVGALTPMRVEGWRKVKKVPIVRKEIIQKAMLRSTAGDCQLRATS
jgi:hypothetical protein